MSRWIKRCYNIDGNIVGETHPRAKLTDHDVELIKALRPAGVSARDIAQKFECAVSTVYAILKGEIRGQVAVYERRISYG